MSVKPVSLKKGVLRDLDRGVGNAYINQIPRLSLVVVINQLNWENIMAPCKWNVDKTKCERDPHSHEKL